MAFTLKPYQESADVQNKKKKMEEYSADYNWRNDQDTVAANAEYKQAKQNKPTYENKYGNYVESAFNALNNRSPFKYDVAGDALYQQYKDQYMVQGQQAMMDTMGQAAALTGGYGNSYAQSVGQQAYQGYLQQLNDKVPELYQLAMQRYEMEGDALKDKYNLARDMSDTEYGQYRDALGDYRNDVNDAYGRFQDALNYGAGQYSENRGWAADQYQTAYSQDYGAFQDQQNMDWQAYQYAQDMALQQSKLAEDRRQFDAKLAQDQAQFDANKEQEQLEFEAQLEADRLKNLKQPTVSILEEAEKLYETGRELALYDYADRLEKAGYNPYAVYDHIYSIYDKKDILHGSPSRQKTQ